MFFNYFRSNSNKDYTKIKYIQTNFNKKVTHKTILKYNVYYSLL